MLNVATVATFCVLNVANVATFNLFHYQTHISWSVFIVILKQPNHVYEYHICNILSSYLLTLEYHSLGGKGSRKIYSYLHIIECTDSMNLQEYKVVETVNKKCKNKNRGKIRALNKGKNFKSIEFLEVTNMSFSFLYIVTLISSPNYLLNFKV